MAIAKFDFPSVSDYSDRMKDNGATSEVSPVAGKSRIQSIDVLRGFALLGILLMNILVFAFPFAAYSDPTIDGATEGLNLAVYASMDVLVEGSMRAIFSMLFGAGMLIFLAKRDTDDKTLRGLFYRRTVLLIVFGLVNAYIFVWPGDILYTYGMAGLLLYFFRDVTAARLAQCSLAIFLLLGIIHIALHMDARNLRAAVEAVESLPEGMPLSSEQEQALIDWDIFLSQQFSSPEMVQQEYETKKSGYIENVVAYAPINLLLQTVVLLFNTLWDVLAMMLLGMAFFKWRMLDASRSSRDYWLLVIVGIGLGLPLNYLETATFISSGFEIYWAGGFRPSYDVSRLSLAVGYIGIIMLICKHALFPLFRSALAAVGQLALTNYLAQSIICNFIFMGFGLGLFGELQRYQAYLVVLGVWLFQIVFSLLWLRLYRFGPAEWLWRSLTYKKSQPLRLGPFGR
ncbi:MAG: hypothetical protein DHS20C12_24250 [Pseudohongiella sp.]|nr:MAG: hypothetical protein DHS20C12_24250 [Pseudohongiella sp.]